MVTFSASVGVLRPHASSCQPRVWVRAAACGWQRVGPECDVKTQASLLKFDTRDFPHPPEGLKTKKSRKKKRGWMGETLFKLLVRACQGG